MYYITQRGALMALQRRFREHGVHVCFHERHALLTIPFTASLSPLSRLYDPSTRTPGFGWQAVATEGDDDIEMTEGT
jgi:hypothetical protein